ncbi:serine hydrolase domain-containing protein [Pelagibacterium limicola]|uniref:serine hydrolase domain-containing protein n=1 Tax=Pelagibacterium limicola TaxID=2791022 RepID=UPI0018AF5AAF|nr:serine hydrolase domain-containing protein [Pelagibacterium limicola]
MISGDPIAAALAAPVAAGELAGVATLVWRDGTARAVCAGVRDIETGLPVERDTLFRIASMTKPVTSVAALMLMEEGRFALGDPITRFAPEFSSLRVLTTPDGPLQDTVPATRPITFEDLLTHCAGFTYADFHTGPIAAAYAEALGGDIDTPLSPDDWIAALAELPLIAQPGAAFHYSHATDLLGLLIARIADAPLGDVLRSRIFDPLGMIDTGFAVPPENHFRRAAPHGFDAAGRLTKRITVPGNHALPERPADMAFASGGQGLWSTLDDYLIFARLFVGGGAVNGVRLLQPETLALMTANHLTPAQRANAQMFGLPLFGTGHSFGLGVAVVTDPATASVTLCGGGVGSVGWPGAYGGWWQADPNDGSVSIFLTHNMVELEQLASGIGLAVYAAIAQFQALVSPRR